MTRQQQARETMLKTGSLKYSASLVWKPMGSFNLISPEMMNKIPTEYSRIVIIYFHLLFLEWPKPIKIKAKIE
jgi:hypothetical protein